MQEPANKKAPWSWIASIWLGIALFSAGQMVLAMHAEGMHHAWANLFVSMFLSWLPWALATPLVLSQGRLHPPVRLKPVSTWLRHLATCTSIALVYSAWTAVLDELLNPLAAFPPPGPFWSLWQGKFYEKAFESVFLYAALLAISQIMDSQERLIRHQIETARLSAELSKAQLDALRRQVEPHFLFNALNAIVGLIREKRNDAAVNMTVGLSDLLRKMLDNSSRQQVPLSEEVEFVQKYLEIQKARFADRLRVSVSIPEELLFARVPSLILQFMVENALKHGIAKRAQGGEIRITGVRANGMLTIRVYNDGPPLPVDWDNSPPGIGMANIRTRLRLLYGGEFQLVARNQDATGVEMSASVPLREG